MKSILRYVPSQHTTDQRNKNMRQTALFNYLRNKEQQGMAFDLSNYETVEDRLVRWWAAYPQGRVRTTLYNYTGDTCVFYTELYANSSDDHPISTGYAEEVKSDRGVNSTSFVENCETSSIGRAIANCPIAHQGHGPRPSRTEMAKVESQSRAVLGSGQAVQRPQSPTSAFATPKQQQYIKALAKGKEWSDGDLLTKMHEILGVQDVILETLSGAQASKVIESMK
jgi:hypothetical protein